MLSLIDNIFCVHKNAVIKKRNPFYALNDVLPLCWQNVSLKKLMFKVLERAQHYQ